MKVTKVISNQPPGGRCTLYSRYAETIATALAWPYQMVTGEHSEAHGNGYPSLWIGDTAIQPSDGVILAPEDICAVLMQHGLPPEQADAMLQQLQVSLDDFLESYNA